MRKILRALARILFVLAFGFFMVFFIGEGLMSGEIRETGIPMNLLIVVVSYFIMFVGFLISLKESKIGGMIILAGGIFNAAFMMFKASVGDLEVAAIFGLPFIIVGIIIIATEDKGYRF